MSAQKSLCFVSKTLLLAFALLLVSPANGWAQTEALYRRVALVIGNAKYTDSPLKNPVNDCRILQKALEAVGFDVELRINRSKEQIKDDIDDITTGLDEGDACLIYFAGHGTQVGGVNYLIPVDANLSKIEQVEQQCVSCDYLVESMVDSECSLRVVVLDCCRDEGFQPKGIAKSAAPVAKGLAKIPAPEGTFIAFATEPGKTASDGLGDSSPFAKHLAERMQAKHSGGLMLRDLFDQTARLVKSEMGQKAYVDRDASMDPFWIVAQPTSNSSGDAGASPAKPETNNLSSQEKTVTNTIGMKLNLIPAGKFMMGSPASEKDRRDNEMQHRVEISQDFYIGVAEVTQNQWEKVMSENPWEGRKEVKLGSSYPASAISWDDAVSFCERLSEIEGKTYRLPTEAEWEYSCRGGTETSYCFGDDDSQLGRNAWFGENAKNAGEKYAHSVGLKAANGFGLHDMPGNVFEWCSDWHADDSYKTSAATDPSGPQDGDKKVQRGGSWSAKPSYCRSAARSLLQVGQREPTVGFRVVLTNE